MLYMNNLVKLLFFFVFVSNTNIYAQCTLAPVLTQNSGYCSSEIVVTTSGCANPTDWKAVYFKKENGVFQEKPSISIRGCG